MCHNVDHEGVANFLHFHSHTCRQRALYIMYYKCVTDRDVVVGSTCYWKYSAQGVLLGCNYPGFEVCDK